MKTIVRKVFLMMILACIWADLGAKVELPSVIGDNMVLQRNTSVALWGKARPSRKVVISPSWTSVKTTVTADSDGKWSAKVQTPGAGGPFEITFSDGESLKIGNILIGEVWLCSGQSNMEMPVAGFGGQPVVGSFEAIMDANPSVPVRMATVARKASNVPLDECKTEWKEHTPEAVASCSATAYFFGMQLYRTLGVPIGLLISNWGGSSIEAWIDQENIEKGYSGELSTAHLGTAELPKNPHQQPACLYNGMIRPIEPYTVKGIIWYQGESNRGRAEQYVRLSKTYASFMREKWGNPDMPFYAVQIAPYNYSDPKATDSPLLQEAQMKASQEIPHAGLATTLDIGNPTCIHPEQKKPVGQRLAALALVKDYGFKGISARAPEYKSMSVKDGKVTLQFDLFGSNLAPIYGPLASFEVAGADKVFHPAHAVIASDRKSITVSCEAVPEPVAVRYAFHNVAEASLFNNYGIPVGPFRTDSW